MKNYLSDNIKHLRTQNNMSQSKLAKLMDKDYSTIGKWELGIRNPLMADVMKLADIFHVPFQDLVEKDLRFNENVDLDDNHTLNKIILEKSYQMSEEDKKMIINIMDSINARNDIKGSDEKE